MRQQTDEELGALFRAFLIRSCLTADRKADPEYTDKAEYDLTTGAGWVLLVLIIAIAVIAYFWWLQ